MADPIWAEARKRARAETLDTVKLDSLPRILLTIGTPVVAFAATLGLTGQLAIAALATVAWTLFCGLLIYLGKLIRAPAKIAAEAQAELAALTTTKKAPKHVIAIAAEAESSPLDANKMTFKIGVTNTQGEALLIDGAQIEYAVNDKPAIRTLGTGFLLHGNADRVYNFDLAEDTKETRDGRIGIALLLRYGLPDEQPTRVIDQAMVVAYQYRGALTLSRCTNARLVEKDI